MMREYPLFLLFSLIAAIFVAGRLWQTSFELHLARSELQFLKKEMGMVVDRRSSLPMLEGSAVSEDSTPIVTSRGGGIDNTPALHGHVDGIEHGQISGWACEEQSNSPPVDVIIYIDDHFLASVESRQPHGDGLLQHTCQVTPSAAGTVNAGFTFRLPPLPPGRHVARLFARDAARRVKMELSNSPIKFQEKLKTLNMLNELKSKDQVIKEKEARIATLTAKLDAMEPVQSKAPSPHPPPFCSTQAGLMFSTDIDGTLAQSFEENMFARLAAPPFACIAAPGRGMRALGLSCSRVVPGEGKVAAVKMSEAQHSSILERLIGRRALPPPSMQQSSLTSANKRNPSVLSRGGTGRLLALVGINTGFDSRPRRDLLRKTWMPHREHFDLLEQKLGIAIRFMIGHYRNANEGFDEKDWANGEGAEADGEGLRANQANANQANAEALRQMERSFEPTRQMVRALRQMQRELRANQANGEGAEADGEGLRADQANGEGTEADGEGASSQPGKCRKVGRQYASASGKEVIDGSLAGTLEEIEREIEEFGDIIRMDHQEDYNQLSTKTKLFFAQFSVQFDAEFYVKVDDDIYVNLDALAAQLETLRGKSNVYMGCMKSGQVINDRRYKWFEPEWWRLGDSGNKYFRHATGQIYVLSHSLASYISMHADILHKFANEDTSVGAWMLALDVDFIDERRMCCQECRQQSQYNMCIAVWQWKCNGVCSAEATMPAIDAQCASADSWRTFVPRTTKL
ncbi:hypothetical protein CYMTET_15776 [Cymbomonas tetramitiformis]|uniref:Uncharacterized protein n=1 Tax=Cymbomonas tetramitiformis TaxID=36881 RepID=A0AAE0GDJ3_9CHLO|nr:hypothetical protein CYMTET_15776 [Cymbomonas tetramitiformis]